MIQKKFYRKIQGLKSSEWMSGEWVYGKQVSRAQGDEKAAKDGDRQRVCHCEQVRTSEKPSLGLAYCSGGCHQKSLNTEASASLASVGPMRK